jgi:hypothetical protein
MPYGYRHEAPGKTPATFALVQTRCAMRLIPMMPPGYVFDKGTDATMAVPKTSAIAIRFLALVAVSIRIRAALVALLRSASALLRTAAALLSPAALLALLATLTALVRAALALVLSLTLILIGHRMLLLTAIHGRGSESNRYACTPLIT